jgi:hypothetical protein
VVKINKNAVSEMKWCGGWLNGVCHEGFVSVVKWSQVKVLVKCVCNSS